MSESPLQPTHGIDVKPEAVPVPTSVALQVVFVQYDRQKYRGSLERLLGVLASLDGVDHSVLVVDNLLPGDWTHRVSDRLTHIGGDNSGWEFSAFDRGLAHLDAIGARAKVYALVTDAYSAYGSDFLSMLNPAMLDGVALRQHVVGWVDGWPDEATLFGTPYREWLRTSLLLLPVEVLPTIRPLAASVEVGALFSDDPGQPFLPDAPLSENLKDYLVEWLTGTTDRPALVERWHSKFRLDGGSLPFFRSKVSAVLREHLLSIRLRASGVPCYDFRLFRRLEEGGRRWADLDGDALAEFGWGRWNAPDDRSLLKGVHHHCDRVELPPPTTHGDPAHFLVEGWLLGTPPPHSVHLRVGPSAMLTGFCNLPRPDVAKAFPGFGVMNPGFVLKGTVRHLLPGSHDVMLDVGAGPPIALGTVEILPLFEFSSRRPIGPDSWPAGKPVPVSIDGELRTSARAESVAVKVDNHPVDVGTFLSEGVCDTQGWWVHEVVVTGHVSALGTSEQHALDLQFTLAGGGLRTWTLPFTVAPTEASCTPRTITVGPYDPDTGLTTVFLDVEVFDVEAGDRLALERNGHRILESALHVSSTPDAAGICRGLAVVDRQVEGIPAGESQFSLVLLRGHRRSIVWKGNVHVRYQRPEIHVEVLTASLVRTGETPTYRLRTSGWIENHFLADCLFVEIGEARAAVIGFHELRPDVAKTLGNPMATRQGFDATIDLAVPSGEHVVHFVARAHEAERGRVSRRVFFEEPPALRLSVQSDDLERLLRGSLVTCYSSITLRGTLRTEMDDVSAALSVNDTHGDEQAFQGPGDHEFSLRAVPPSSGEYDVRLTLRSGGRLAFQSDPARVIFQQMEFPQGLDRDLGTLLDRFGLRSKIAGTMSDRELLTWILEAQPERVHEFGGMLVEAAKRIGVATPNRRWIEPPDVASPRRLKVLFASWETPTRRHGGGVYLRALLSRLGARHDITLVHSCGLDEVGQADSLRPHLRRIISVPRAHTPARYRGTGRFPLHLYDGYTPELQRVLELEVASGSYDLVDYEYSAMGPYVVPGVPSVLTVHELGYTALLNTVFDVARPAELVVRDLDRFVRSFHYFTSVLPSICSRLITLADEDAAEVATFSSADVYTSPSGVELDDAPARTTRQGDECPAFAYMGNFRHPPNARAAMFFAQKVMPQILRRYPLAEFRIYGPDVSGEVRDLDGKDGVRVVGFVDDLRSALRSATAVVSPIFTGTGQRIKVLEALGAGALVIGTDLSVRSIRVIDGEHYVRANTAEEFVAAALRAIEHPDEARRVGRAGRDRVAEMHSWEAAVRRREAIWFHALGEA